MTLRFLNRAQVAERAGVTPESLSHVKLPEPDVTIGPVNADGSLPRGSVRGWSSDTIDEWVRTRPGPGRPPRDETKSRRVMLLHSVRRQIKKRPDDDPKAVLAEELADIAETQMGDADDIAAVKAEIERDWKASK